MLFHAAGVIPSIGTLLTTLVDPAALLLVFLVLASGLCLRRRNWLEASILIGLAILIEVTLGTTLSRRLLADLETPYLPGRQQLPVKADAIVMLGGAHEYNPRELFQMGFIEASDRIVTAVELLRQDRAGALVLCSAKAVVNDREVPDSEFIERLMERWNLRRGRIIRLPIGRNTVDEAHEVAALASKHGWKRILLVSSAFHLRRAEATFRKAGVGEIIPVGCDFRGVFPGDPGYDHITLPRTESATALKLWLHEQVGWWYYDIRGWR